MAEPASKLPLGAVLAGGESRRFGTDKAAHRFEGRSLLDWVFDVIDSAGLPVALVGGPARPEATQARRHLPDAPALTGPLAGLSAALSAAEAEGRPGVILLACDQPGVTEGVIQSLSERATTDPTRAAAYAGDTGIDPFPGYYPVTITPLIAESTSLRNLLKRVRPPAWVFPRDGRRSFPPGTFDNVNTPADLERFARRRRR